jgi:Tfp pilus assembly pilus retraction ATPase PilT
VWINSLFRLNYDPTDSGRLQGCLPTAYLTDKQQKRLELEFEVDFAFGIEKDSRDSAETSFFQRGSLDDRHSRDSVS